MEKNYSKTARTLGLLGIFLTLFSGILFISAPAIQLLENSSLLLYPVGTDFWSSIGGTLVNGITGLFSASDFSFRSVIALISILAMSGLMVVWMLLAIIKKNKGKYILYTFSFVQMLVAFLLLSSLVCTKCYELNGQKCYLIDYLIMNVYNGAKYNPFSMLFVVFGGLAATVSLAFFLAESILMVVTKNLKVEDEDEEEDISVAELLNEIGDDVELDVASLKEKRVRVPFVKRILRADKQTKERYNEIKSELMSYRAHSRISLGGDTFRVHNKRYAKITMSGKNLKIYFALDPNDYADSPIPCKDVSNKESYKDIPYAFKVKSDLSVRRAKKLIADAMAKDEVPQKEVIPCNWVKNIKSGLF